MERIEYNFKLKDIKNIFKKKKCPYCGNTKLTKRTVKEFKGKTKSQLDGMEFNADVDLYAGTIVYQCEKCKKEFVLQALSDKTKLIESIPKNNINDNEDTFQNNTKNRVSIFFKLLTIIMLFSVLSVAISDKNIVLFLVATPIILITYFLTKVFTR